MKRLIISLLLVSTAYVAVAQDYDWAIGARGGGMASGLTVKHKMNVITAWEITLNAWYEGGFIATGMLEWYQPIIGDGFNLYYGGGFHLGTAKFKKYDSRELAFGIDAVLGLEYRIPKAPIALSVDYRPYFNLVRKFYFGAYDVGLGVKVCF